MQLAAPDHLRGRIIGIYFYAFNGTGPLAGLFVGWLCAKGGTELAFAVAGVVGIIATLVAAARLGARQRMPRPLPATAAGGGAPRGVSSTT